jgi:hypothetical protein
VFRVDLETKSDYFRMQSKQLTYIIEMENVYCAVRTESLNITRLIFFFKLSAKLRSKRIFLVPETVGYNIDNTKDL